MAELTRRGLAVVLYPFVMMDVPAGNALPDPYRPGETQPAYPWRGRMTCDPAPDRAGSPDATGGAADQVAAFFEGRQGYRAMILHYAGLAAGWAAAGAPLAGFVLGSEFVGLTRVRGPAGAYPAVAQLRRLATEVRARLGRDVSLVYAADWTEYGAHVRDGGASVRFPPRSALCRSGHRCRRHRLLPADFGLARRVGSSRRGGRRQPLRPRLSQEPPRGRRGVRLVLRQPRGSRRATPYADHRRRPREPVDLPGQGSRRVVVEPACRAGRRRRDRADGLDAGRQADLAHRDRHPGGRSRHQRAQRLPRSEIVRERRSALLPRLPRRPDPGPRPRRDPLALRSWI
ncbi:protein of unknown function [Methylorubrum extorquens]|uniref:GTA TIM-barrel-like domain-containing protein n=1 Tax=Methylorubrum extorquens TaxID=408 RepID=A0A2N9AV65_METEX|nr:protein of unknown function [Methylorubrum extorquens]